MIWKTTIVRFYRKLNKNLDRKEISPSNKQQNAIHLRDIVSFHLIELKKWVYSLFFNAVAYLWNLNDLYFLFIHIVNYLSGFRDVNCVWEPFGDWKYSFGLNHFENLKRLCFFFNLLGKKCLLRSQWSAVGVKDSPCIVPFVSLSNPEKVQVTPFSSSDNSVKFRTK